MGSESRYWRLIRLDGTGQRKVEEVAIARPFFQEQFSSRNGDTPGDSVIQRELVQVMRQNHRDQREAAGLCLRCYVSQEIEYECIRLEQKFGDRHGFRRADLFPFVLDDDGRQSLFGPSASPYRPFAFEVVQTFDPQQARLNTWVVRLVKSNRALNGFLRECGIYLESDWSLLNQTRREHLQRILTEFHTVATVEVDLSCAVLQAYHGVYRQDRLQQRQQGVIKGKEKCAPPTPEQLDRMAQQVRDQVPQPLSRNGILSRLQAIALQIRQYRLSAPPLQSFDQFETPLDVAAPEPDPVDEDQNEFLTFYRQQFVQGLDQALATVVGERIAYLQRKKPQNVEPYLNALHLFHCQGRSMGAIARELGLRAQDAVTRLLELKNFRASVRQTLLMRLCDQVLEKSKIYASATQLQELDQRIAAALDEQISTLIQQAENEATVARDRPLESIFARRLCHYLDTRNLHHD